MELQESICLPSDTGDSQLSAQSASGESEHSGDSAGLAKETLVPATHLIEHQKTTSFASDTGSANAVVNSSSGSGETQADGLGLGRQRLINLGCSARVTDTLMKARKDSTNSAYSRIWNKFVEFAIRHDFSPDSPSLPHTGIPSSGIGDGSLCEHAESPRVCHLCFYWYPMGLGHFSGSFLQTSYPPKTSQVSDISKVGLASGFGLPFIGHLHSSCFAMASLSEGNVSRGNNISQKGIGAGSFSI